MYKFSIKDTNVTLETKDNKLAIKCKGDNDLGMRGTICEQATTKAIKSNNYRYELERVKHFNKFLVEARIDRKSTKHIDSNFGGYKVRTILLKDIKIVLRSIKDNKLKIVTRLDHLWINEEENTIARDKNIEIDDIVRFYGNVGEYTYSHGRLQLNINQIKRSHKNMTQSYEYSK